MSVVTTRPLHEIAEDIYLHWPPAKARRKAEPYLEVMRGIALIGDKIGADDGKHVILRFLGNAQGWKGPDARRIKAELWDIVEENRIIERMESALAGKTRTPGPAEFARSKRPRHG